MASNRIKKETLFLHRDFTEAERLEMGAQLAQAHNHIAAIADEEASMKAGIKEKRAGVELTIGSLSRKLNDGYDMENTVCTLDYDQPQVGEVTYHKPDGSIVKTRAMTEQERHMDLPLVEVKTAAEVEKSIEQSTAAAEEFFGKPEAESESEETPATKDELPAEYEEQVRQSLGAPEPFGDKPRLVDARPTHKKSGPKELAEYHTTHSD